MQQRPATTHRFVNRDQVADVAAETVDGRPSFNLCFRLPGPIRPAVGSLPAKLWLVGVREGGEAEGAGGVTRATFSAVNSNQGIPSPVAPGPGHHVTQDGRPSVAIPSSRPAPLSAQLDDHRTSWLDRQGEKCADLSALNEGLERR